VKGLSGHGCTMGHSASRTTGTLLIIIFISEFSFTIPIRKDIGFKFIPFCNNTVQGRFLLSDNNGMISFFLFFIFLFKYFLYLYVYLYLVYVWFHFIQIYEALTRTPIISRLNHIIEHNHMCRCLVDVGHD